MSGAVDPIRVLVVDDDDDFREVMTAELVRRGYDVDSAATGRGALAKCDARDGRVILLDLHLPDVEGIEVLGELARADLAKAVVVLTGHGTIDTAIQAIRLGAYDYLEKPCPIEKVELTIKKTREHLGLLARQRVLQDGYSPPDVRLGMVGASPAFLALRQEIARFARSDAATLILGETGVGKDMAARLLHTESARRDAPFVVVDCASLHEELLLSELFGHEKGAFSGAARRKHGLFEVANGGTLFLDEVGDASPDIQAKLLRVLETGRFRRLGGTSEIAVDVRIVAATNRDLQRAIEQGRFREDLFFRLSTFTLEVPPLRERGEDIPRLVEHFVQCFNRRFARNCSVGADALGALARYAWPGNVRELIHVLERAVVLSDRGVIELAQLPEPIRGRAAEARAPDRPAESRSLRDVERRHVLAILDEVAWNRAQAARVLGISERNLYRLIKRHGWSPSTSPQPSEPLGP